MRAPSLARVLAPAEAKGVEERERAVRERARGGGGVRLRRIDQMQLQLVGGGDGNAERRERRRMVEHLAHLHAQGQRAGGSGVRRLKERGHE
eukprot:6057235-Pleurochrysis_carterae.AAC.1